MKLLITGDNHLRMDRPVCRLDEDWIWTQKSQLDYIVDMANEREADLVITGDLFHRPKVPPKIVSLFLHAIVPLLGKCYILAGNHSLPEHREENAMDGSIGILKALSCEENSKIIYLPADEYLIDGRFEHCAKIADDLYIVHTLTFPTVSEIPPQFRATSAIQLLDKYPEARFIFTGDYHKSFVVEDENRWAINPGCMNIQVADEIEYDPCIYFVDTGAAINVTTIQDRHPVYRTAKHVIERIPLVNDRAVLTREHLDQKLSRDDRIASFVETILQDGSIGLSFEDNLDHALLVNELTQAVRDVLQEAKEGWNE